LIHLPSGRQRQESVASLHRMSALARAHSLTAIPVGIDLNHLEALLRVHTEVHFYRGSPGIADRVRHCRGVGVAA